MKLIRLEDIEEMINILKTEFNKHYNNPESYDLYGKGWVQGNNEFSERIISSLSSLPTQESKKLAIDFAEWYHNGLLNRERKTAEEEFERFINLHPNN